MRARIYFKSIKHMLLWHSKFNMFILKPKWNENSLWIFFIHLLLCNCGQFSQNQTIFYESFSAMNHSKMTHIFDYLCCIFCIVVYVYYVWNFQLNLFDISLFFNLFFSLRLDLQVSWAYDFYCCWLLLFKKNHQVLVKLQSSFDSYMHLAAIVSLHKGERTNKRFSCC